MRNPKFDISCAVIDFLSQIHKHKQQLFDELLIYACDDVLYKRRLRMLWQLADHERQIMEKIYRMPLDHADMSDMYVAISEILDVTNRSS